MPKVSQEYIQNKRDLIVRTAYDLCLQKSISTVTMQDIINATGLSQGGIYRFYKNIDEIFRDMLIDNRNRVDIKEQVDDIFLDSEKKDIRIVLHEIFKLLSDFMTKELMSIVKINFELSVLSMNAPHRVEKILGEIEGTGNFEYLFMRVSQYLKEYILNHSTTTKVGLEELLTYLTTSYNGIEMSCIINYCYKKLPLMEWYTPKTQLRTLEATLYYLLGLED